MSSCFAIAYPCKCPKRWTPILLVVYCCTQTQSKVLVLFNSPIPPSNVVKLSSVYTDIII